jgi:phosphoribosylanthranilate isomerase
MQQVKLKICGITSLEDARAAIECGADYLGFNFYRPSPRYIAPAAAHEIIAQLPGEVITVGVFVNEARPEDALEIIAASGVQMAQLHGDEDASYCTRIGAERVIKVLRIGDGFEPRRALEFPVAAILLDTYDAKLYGGTGRTLNWAAAREVAQLTRVFLAGGLTPENVGEAIRAVEPYAVDVNSGVENAPGRKGTDKLRKLKREMEMWT